MTDKTSEDLVFDKLRTPSVQEMFAQQLYERRDIKDNIFFRLYFMKKSPNGDYEVKTCKISEIQSVISGYEYDGMSGSMPVFKLKD